MGGLYWMIVQEISSVLGVPIRTFKPEPVREVLSECHKRGLIETRHKEKYLRNRALDGRFRFPRDFPENSLFCFDWSTRSSFYHEILTISQRSENHAVFEYYLTQLLKTGFSSGEKKVARMQGHPLAFNEYLISLDDPSILNSSGIIIGQTWTKYPISENEMTTYLDSIQDKIGVTLSSYERCLLDHFSRYVIQVPEEEMRYKASCLHEIYKGLTYSKKKGSLRSVLDRGQLAEIVNAIWVFYYCSVCKELKLYDDLEQVIRILGQYTEFVVIHQFNLSDKTKGFLCMPRSSYGSEVFWFQSPGFEEHLRVWEPHVRHSVSLSDLPDKVQEELSHGTTVSDVELITSYDKTFLVAGIPKNGWMKKFRRSDKGNNFSVLLETKWRTLGNMFQRTKHDLNRRKQLSRMRALNETRNRLTYMGNVESLKRDVCSEIAQTTKMLGGVKESFLEEDYPHNTFRLTYSAEDWTEEDKRKLEDMDIYSEKTRRGAFVYVTQKHRPYYAASRSDPVYRPLFRDSKCSVATPVLFQDRLHGVICIDGLHEEQFSEQDLVFMQMFSDMLGHKLQMYKIIQSIVSLNSYLEFVGRW